jgi:hypothetical protein
MSEAGGPPTLSFEDYLRVEATGQRTVALKLVHIDMAGDLIAGVLLSQLVYWHSPNRETGEPRLSFERDGHRWLRKSYDEWHDECRLTVAQARRAVEKLLERGLVETHVWRHDGTPTLHLRIVGEAFMAAFDLATSQVTAEMRSSANGLVAHSVSAPDLSQSANGNAPDSKSEMRSSASHIGTETTSESTELPPTAVPPSGGHANGNGEVALRSERASEAATATLARLKAELDAGRRSWSLSDAAKAEWLALLEDVETNTGPPQQFVIFYLAANTGRDRFAPFHWSMAGRLVRRWRGLVLHGVDEAITRIDPDDPDERGRIGRPFWSYVEAVCQRAHADLAEGRAS